MEKIDNTIENSGSVGNSKKINLHDRQNIGRNKKECRCYNQSPGAGYAFWLSLMQIVTATGTASHRRRREFMTDVTEKEVVFCSCGRWFYIGGQGGAFPVMRVVFP